MKITILTPDLSGKEISCKIESREILSAKIYYDKGSYYIIQDQKCGGWASVVERSGFKYKYGWKCQYPDNPGYNRVFNIELKDGTISNYEIY